MKRVVVSALLGVTLLASTAHAQDQWEREVRNQLAVVGATSERNGYHMATDIYQGRLDDDATTNLNVDLVAGKDYVLWGVCDRDCTDIDLTIYNSNGDEVASDLQTDNIPYLHVIPSRSGNYRIKVSMAVCSANPCRFGVGLWSKDGGSAITSAPSSGSEGDRFEAQVRTQLNDAGHTWSEKGFAMSHEVFMGRLDDDANESLNIPLDGGTRYVIVGVCDQDCTDVDLTVYDSNGREVASDVETNDKPTVQVTPTGSGQYRVKVSMVACTGNPCRYGVGVWAK